jgi:hypothetical protein
VADSHDDAVGIVFSLLDWSSLALPGAGGHAAVTGAAGMATGALLLAAATKTLSLV